MWIKTGLKQTINLDHVQVIQGHIYDKEQGIDELLAFMQDGTQLVLAIGPKDEIARIYELINERLIQSGIDIQEWPSSKETAVRTGQVDTG